MRTCIVEYGVGNIQSVANACREMVGDTVVASDGDSLRAAMPERIVLPGVGAIGTALENLRARGLVEVLEHLVRESGIPFLGICVGMQVLAESCEEFGAHRALGWIPGRVKRLAPEGSSVRLPHVGWNSVLATHPVDPLLCDIVGKDAYFVHSYAFECPRQFIAATTEYDGISFPSAVRNGNIFGVQFHPEKSAAIGAALLSAFLEDQSCSSVG
jgi:glutamine amidotransferase